MPITIELPRDVEESAIDQATKEGLPVQDYLTSLVKEGIERRAEVTRLSSLAFDDLLKPVRLEFKESGMSEGELDKLIEEAREEVWREKQLQQK